MDERRPVALSAIVIDERWNIALDEALEQIKDVAADVVFLFVSSEYASHYKEMLQRVRASTRAPFLVGCSGLGVVGDDQELEDLPAVSLLALSLPGALLHPVYLTQDIIRHGSNAEAWRGEIGVARDDVNAWLVFASSPYAECIDMVQGLSRAYPGLPILGGLSSSGEGDEERAYAFLHDGVYTEGIVALAIGGDYSIFPAVSQGCEPIGEPWTITRVLEDGMVASISSRPAYEMLVRTFEGLNQDLQRRAQRNLLIGLAADEYQDTFGRGSFLIRRLMGADRRTGSLVIGAVPRVGQTIQFQMRDPVSADQDLHDLLARVKSDLALNPPIAAILCTCAGRGIGMFGIPDHDASAVMREFAQMPLAGFFSRGEIGPVGKKTFLHGFTASLAFFIRK